MHAPRITPTSLVLRIFVVNAGLIVAGVVLLAATPLTITHPLTPLQAIMLVVGAAILLAANFVLLRVSMRPLRRLEMTMERVDLLRPGQRLQIEGAPELNVVIGAFNTMVERLERERRQSSTRAVNRDEAERRRLAGELHDEVGQGLTALLLRLRTMVDDAPEPLRAQLIDAQQIARNNLDEVRRIARRLRPTVLDDLGLPAALLALAEAVEDQDNLNVVRLIDGSTPAVSHEAELALYRIAQEALTNVIRHASARSVEIQLCPDNGGAGVRLDVRDDGRGMILAADDTERGGIRGMRERALAMNGTLSITSRPGNGTCVSVTVGLEALTE